MFKFERSNAFSRSAIALITVFGVGLVSSGAQSTTAVQQPSAQAQPSLDLSVPAVDTSNARLFSSSVDEDAAPVTVASLHPTVVNFAEAMQYGGGQRKRYGKTRYRGANSNADGSQKYIFFGGAGLAQPTGNTFHYLTPSYGIQIGGGRQFNKHFSVPIQFDYDHFGMAGETLQNQTTVYNTQIAAYNAANGYGPGDANYADPIAGLDGNSHVWSFSVDPTYTLYSGEGVGAYVVAGVGFYHKVANFTQPESGCDPYYLEYYGICEPYTENQVIDHYTSNAPGFSGGFGLTYKFSKFASQRFYAEVRYVFVDNSQRQGVNAANVAQSNFNTNNDYPANSNRTTYVPIKVGIRF